MGMGSSHGVDTKDPFGRYVGFQTAILAILLTLFTIMAHRSHTETIIEGNKANSGWAYYQAKRLRSYQTEMNTALIQLMATPSPKSEALLAEYHKQIEKYKEELAEIKETTEKQEKKEHHAHQKASIFDLAEGLLEIGMILSSLYFLTKKNFFPIMGAFMASIGVIIGIFGLIH